jgi:hypothetical protein
VQDEAVAERVRVREIDDDEGRRLRICGDLVAGAAGAAIGSGDGRAAITKVAITGEDRVRDVIRNFSADGFGRPSAGPARYQARDHLRRGTHHASHQDRSMIRPLAAAGEGTSTPA